MVVEQSYIDHIMRGLQSTEGVRLHNHRKKLRQRFDIIKKLGQGTYGKVQLGINKETGQEVAIKAIKKCKIDTEADLVRIRREIQIMSSVRHPNIIHIYEVFENREKMVLVMEYAAGGELYDFLCERKVLEEAEARRIFRQISTAVYYCHKHKICHRDLKLENILLDEHGNAKIADFGLSNVYDDQRLLNSFCGSPLYASPEIVKGTPYHGPEVDCWSLGVLLYTLIYGAMPFESSNFKRLVKQISQGVYFEPKNPSPASPLIREMLTVNPQKRATIEQICSHWWVNQGFNVSCLDIAEDLANQTPVRLDLLLSLAPPPNNPEKLVVTDEQAVASQDVPTRSLSVGSFMELDPNTEQRIRDFVTQEVTSEGNEKTVKRKLEADASESSIKKEGVRKKERIKQSSEHLKEPEESAKQDDSSSAVMDVDTKTNKLEEKEELTVTEPSAKIEEVKKPEDVEKVQAEVKPIEEKTEQAISKVKPTRKSVKIVKKEVVPKPGEADKKEEVEGTESKVKVKKKKKEEGERKPKEAEKVEEKADVKEDDEQGKEIKRESVMRKSTTAKKEEKAATPEPPALKLAERRKSKVFETAEKFVANDVKSPSPEKPKKVFVSGVKVSDFAKAFERKLSLTSTPSVKSSPSRRSVSKEIERKSEERTKESPELKTETENSSQETEQTECKLESEAEAEGEERKPVEITDEKLKKLKDSARNVISNALVEEERKKIKKQILKPPVPKMKSEESENKKPLTLHIGKETATVHVHSPENTKFLFDTQAEAAGENKENIDAGNEKKTSKMEITLRSNVVPRNVTSRAEVRLNSPPPAQEKTGKIRTEVEQRVGDPQAVYTTQRSEVAFPVSAAQRPIRSMSLEPERRKPQPTTKERIIPIQMEDGGQKDENEARDRVRDLERPKMPYQRTQSQRSASLSRQSTQDSDTEVTPTAPGEAIKKSPREFIIPIAVEGGGYVTPRATSLEPSDTLTSRRGIRPFSRKISLFSDNGSEDESPFSTIQRHPSRDLDEPFRLHRLRSTRPLRSSAEKADSASGSEEEDDDGFEILTAENLFSTLLSRVRSLTQRLNVESSIRPGFPSPRLMNHFGPSERIFSNFHQPLQTRLSDRTDLGRTVSRDIENGFNRWSRGNLNNSDSTRSLSRDKMKRSESDTESISESSYSSSRRKTNTTNEKKMKRTKTALLTSVNSEERRSEERSGIPRIFHPKSYQRQVSDSELMDPVHHSLSMLHRTMSLKSDRAKKADRKTIGICDELTDKDSQVKDFYDVLAEKYGIKNVKRYDLPQKKVEDEMKQAEELPPIPPKTKKEETEKCKTPSKKLAAVLNKLENGHKAKGKGKTQETQKEDEIKVVDKEKLAGLSPQALELYERTLALYQKKEEGKDGKEGKAKSSIPRKVSVAKRETPEKSVLSKYLQGMDESDEKTRDEYFNEKKLKHYGELRSRLKEEKNRNAEDEGTLVRKRSLKEGERVRRLSKELERESSKEEDKNKNKLVTSLERKLDKLRGEKKYVDKAIRSLRESSVGPTDVSSENVLIKRAVSVSDCASKAAQSTVNSVLGMLKKIEGPELKKEETNNESKISVVDKAENRHKPTVKIDITEANRRASYTSNSYVGRNDLPLNKSPSSLFGLDDSSSLRSPDSESFDSWSVCSDLGSPDDVFYRTTTRHSAISFDEMSTESVGERIRRKSFYSRFNERKKPRRSSLLDPRKKYDTEDSKNEIPRKLYDDTRPRPFYKTLEADRPVYRKTSLEWPKTASGQTFARSNSQSSTFSGYATLSRSYMDSLDNSRFGRITDSLHRNASNDQEKPLSPTYSHPLNQNSLE